MKKVDTVKNVIKFYEVVENYSKMGLTFKLNQFNLCIVCCGGVAERSKAADWKSVDGSLRAFESFPLHHFFSE